MAWILILGSDTRAGKNTGPKSFELRIVWPSVVVKLIQGAALNVPAVCCTHLPLIARIPEFLPAWSG